MSGPAETMYDVIIVGGGPAGCAVALGLERANPSASFLLIDDTDPKTFKIGESLPPEAQRILRYLSPNSIFPKLGEDTRNGVHISCTGNASVWESGELTETFAMMNPFGMGWHLDRVHFEETLRGAVEDVSLKVQPMTTEEGKGKKSGSGFVKARFVGVEKLEKGGKESWCVQVEELEMKTVKQYHSKWLIDATGRKASVAHKLGAKITKNDNLLAFYAVFSSPLPDKDRDRRTLLEASPTGWWYTSQLGNNLRVVVYHTDDDDPTAKQARKREGFLDLMQDQTEYVSKIIEGMDYRILSGTGGGGGYPKVTAACSSILEPSGEEAENGDGCSWFAVGDAAIAFDPLSSQGMITALQIGCSVGTIIAKKLRDEAEGKGGAKSMEQDEDYIPGLYRKVKDDYDKKKLYFYSQCRFDTEFWARRRRV
ncbi:FAD/NAD(P)-binding domain-containing protein [Pluteus cervinus]|uniref:FAD/NAD(P)-binding domain-containing protein n=1 Tax=Pluteus cervinus TaxID=181527 RepID=A0ACD3BB96_9AGAR|nr:FAD/NAD(P)-binding domain-containing protein [Pluteus cervinus]